MKELQSSRDYASNYLLRVRVCLAETPTEERIVQKNELIKQGLRYSSAAMIESLREKGA